MQQINLYNNLQYKYPFKRQQTDDETLANKQYILSPLLSCALAVTDCFLVENIPPRFAKSVIKKMVKINKSLSKAQINNFEAAFDKVFKKSKLSDFKVSIFKCNDLKKDIYKIKEHIKKNINPEWLKKYPLEEYYKTVLQYMETDNSCYTFFDKTIYTSKNTRLSLFHEMGHAYNHNKTVFAKALQKARGCHQVLLLPLSLTAICLDLPQKNNQSKHNNSKLNTFLLKLKDYFVKLSPLILFSSFLPTLIEEGLASIRGEKFAKNVLDTNTFNKVKRTNLLGFSTYLFFALFSSLVLWAALKLKNSLLEKLNKT